VLPNVKAGGTQLLLPYNGLKEQSTFERIFIHTVSYFVKLKPNLIVTIAHTGFAKRETGSYTRI
jgi:hypothetical protein